MAGSCSQAASSRARSAELHWLEVQPPNPDQVQLCGYNPRHNPPQPRLDTEAAAQTSSLQYGACFQQPRRQTMEVGARQEPGLCAWVAGWGAVA